MGISRWIAALAIVVAMNPATGRADMVAIGMHAISADGIGLPIGVIIAEDSANGLVLHLNLAAALTPGAHGFHVHKNGSCEPGQKDGQPVAGLAAGGHYDPAGSGRHLGPGGEGHMGDLPVLFVSSDANGARAIDHALVAPQLTVADIRGRALMIHEGGDSFRDEPRPLGGGGARVACGVVPESSRNR